MVTPPRDVAATYQRACLLRSGQRWLICVLVGVSTHLGVCFGSVLESESGLFCSASTLLLLSREVITVVAVVFARSNSVFVIVGVE